MKLYLSTTSPFSRLCVIAAYRAQKTALQFEFVLPWENPAELLAVNPYSQIPALLCDNGEILTETPVILNHLDARILNAANAKFSFGLSTINQTVKAFTLELHREKQFPKHPDAIRAEKALERGLKAAPLLNVDNISWNEISLGNALNYVRMRMPDFYANFVSAENKNAVERFLQLDFMQKTEAERLQLKPRTVADL